MTLVKRNMLVYFRDGRNVFFSLFSVMLMVGMYVLFLGRSMEQALQSMIGTDLSHGPVMTSIILAGMAATTSVTIGMIGIYRFVDDKEGAAKDFLTTPISRRKIIFSYVTGAALIGLIMTTAILTISIFYLVLNGSNILTVNNVFRIIVTAVLTTLCANSMVFMLTTITKTRESFSSLITLVSTIIGFAMGVFLPMGNMPHTVARVLHFFPLNHGASMFRQIFADEKLANLFAGVPVEYLHEFRMFFGIALQYGDYVSSFWFSAGVLAVTAVVFYGLSLAIMRK
ncbi:MAG: ABC transporter permease [Defluviitaleaceae bacterium]|nr:ABC transporter permease [Defluviitaleaceae bacterium]